MIPLKEQEAIRWKFAQELAGQVKIDFFTEREVALELPGRRPCVNCKPARLMLQELAALSDLISLRRHIFDEATEGRAQFGIERIPGIVLRGAQKGAFKFYGMPGGTQFFGFIETIVDISRGEVLLSDASVKALRKLEEDVSLRVFVTPTCPYSPQMAHMAGQLALAAPSVKAEVIVVNDFPELGERYGVRAVPLMLIADRVPIAGAVGEEVLVKQLLKAAASPLSEPVEVSGPTTPYAPEQPAQAGEARPSGLIVP